MPAQMQEESAELLGRVLQRVNSWPGIEQAAKRTERLRLMSPFRVMPLAWLADESSNVAAKLREARPALSASV